jgi:hypothetical protein
MKADQAWQAVLQQLQLEMAKSTYDQQVAGAHLVEYNDREHIFVIGVSTNANLEWLESRLTSTITRLLVGLMGQDVDLKFIVQPAHATLTEENDEAPKPDFEIDFYRGTVYSEILRPDAAVYFPAYWFRWVAYIGTGPFLSLLALRQTLYYQASKFSADCKFQASASFISAIVGLDRKTFEGHRDGIKKNSYTSAPKLNAFITVDRSEADEGTVVDGQFQRAAHHYKFLPEPVTPYDTKAILEYLLDHGFDTKPIEALEYALASEIHSIIPKSFPKLSKLEKREKPTDLIEKIKSLCKPGLSEAELSRVIELSAKLRTKVVSSLGMARVSHYFLKYLTDYLDITPAVLIMWLRTYGFYSHAEMREKIKIKGGRQQIANFLGISLSGVYNHLPRNQETEKQKRIGEFITEYLVRDGDVVINVKMEDHLIPDHLPEYQMCADLVSQFELNTYKNIDVEHVTVRKTAKGYKIKWPESFSTPLLESFSTPLSESFFTPFAESLSTAFGESLPTPIKESFFTSLKNLKESHFTSIVRVIFSGNIKYLILNTLKPKILKNLLLNINTDSTTPGDQPKKSNITIKWVLVGEVWDFKNLFTTCRINKATQQKILDNQAAPQAFVSHLMHAFSPEGRGIHQPVYWAVSQILRAGDGDLGYEPRHDRLAALGPSGVQKLIKTLDASSGITADKNLPGAHDLEIIMGENKNMAKLYDLAELLGLIEIRYQQKG